MMSGTNLTVNHAVFNAVPWAMCWAVVGTVYGAVDDAMCWAVDDATHPAIQDFLWDAGFES